MTEAKKVLPEIYMLDEYDGCYYNKWGSPMPSEDDGEEKPGEMQMDPLFEPKPKTLKLEPVPAPASGDGKGSGPYTGSVERMNNKLAHFALVPDGNGGIKLDMSNVHWICRLFQGSNHGGTWNRAKVLKAGHPRASPLIASTRSERQIAAAKAELA
jgi:hypothetical protein